MFWQYLQKCICHALIQSKSHSEWWKKNTFILYFSFSKSTANEKLMAYAKYSYDARGKRIRLREVGSFKKKSFHIDVLLLYKLVMKIKR